MKNCTLDFSNILPSKCFGLSSNGSVSTGVPAIDTAFKVACQAECHAEPWVTARWVCCKLPGFLDCGDCPSTVCDNRCKKGLISWSAGIDNIYGLDEIQIKDMSYVKTDQNKIITEVKFEFPKDITIKGHAKIGGLLSAVPGLAHIPTSINVKGKINNPKFSMFMTTEIFCSKGKLGVKKITMNDLYMNKGDISLDLDMNSFEAWTKILSVVVKKVVSLFDDVIRSSINEKVIPIIGEKISGAIADATNNIITVDYPC